MLKRLILVTGPPGVGKTSVLLRSVNGLKKRTYRIGGMISHDVREGGIRVGFEIMDFSTGQRGWLAHINQPKGPKISKYRVNLTDLDAIGVNSILDAIKNSDRQNARIEHDKALERAVLELLTDDTELFKQFSDNPSFRKWLADSVFALTYEEAAHLADEGKYLA